MAMRTASPWWLSLVLGVGLFLFFIGERLFGHESGVRGVMSMLVKLVTYGSIGLPMRSVTFRTVTV